MYERLMRKRSTRIRYAKSAIEVDGDVARVMMANGKVAVIDARFAKAVGEWSWCDNGAGYALNGSGPRRVYLHRFVLWMCGVECGALQVDHINNDRLDNRLANLRVVTRSENQRNRKASGAVQYRGVVWDNRRRVYRASITRHKKKFHLGRFATAIDAAKAYDFAAKAHGGVCRLNFEE